MATVSVEFSVYSDPRYKLLGKLTKTDYFGAIGRVSALWMHCIDRNVSVLSKSIVDAMANKNGYAEAMIQAELAEPIEEDDQRVRIRGTQGRIEYLAAARDRQKKATEAAKQKRLEKEIETSESDLDSNLDSSTSPTSDSNISPSLESNVGTRMDVSFSNNASSSASTSASAFTSSSSKEENIAQGSLSPDAQESFLPESEIEEPKNLVSQVDEPKDPLDPEGPSTTALTWRSYREAYKERHGEAPLWNAKTGGQLKSFVSRVPKEEAPLIAAFYLTHSDQFYVKSMHSVGLLLRDAEKLRTEWVTGRKITSAQAKESEQKDANVEAMKTYLARKGLHQ
jgi:hypothetical protein